jgi:carbonic anhydrase
MPRTLPFAALLIAVLLSPRAEAAKWVSIGSKDQAKIEVDSSSLYAPGEGRMRLWHREIYARPSLPDSGAFSFSRLTTLSEFYCDKRLAVTLQQSYAAADGSELKNETFESREILPLTPDSKLETVYTYACRKKAPPVVIAPPPPPAPEPVVENKEAAKKTKNGKKNQEPPPPPPPPPHWTYTGETGVDKWGSLGKDYATCSLGHRQSPIDIRRTVKADLPPLKFAYKPVPLSIIDNGHSIKVDTPDAGSLTLEGVSYELVQFHFHKPSEERINGKTYDMVAHLVHQSKDGKLAVLSVLMEAGKEQSLIRTLWNHLPLEAEKQFTYSDVKIDPSLLLPAKRNYYTFLGSLTTPPCTEGVLWLVLKAPLQISKEQLASFATIYRNNVRPVQGVNNRVIKESR